MIFRWLCRKINYIRIVKIRCSATERNRVPSVGIRVEQCGQRLKMLTERYKTFGRALSLHWDSMPFAVQRGRESERIGPQTIIVNLFNGHGRDRNKRVLMLIVTAMVFFSVLENVENTI